MPHCLVVNLQLTSWLLFRVSLIGFFTGIWDWNAGLGLLTGTWDSGSVGSGCVCVAIVANCS